MGAPQSLPSSLIEDVWGVGGVFLLWLLGEGMELLEEQLWAHSDITSCLSVQQHRLIPDRERRCPAGQLWSWPPSALQPPQSRIRVKAVSSLKLKLPNLPQGPQMLLVSLWPLTCRTKAERIITIIIIKRLRYCRNVESSRGTALKQRVILTFQASGKPISVFILLFISLFDHSSLSRWCCRATAKGK